MDKKRRKSIRLKDFDYSSNGMYYITICSKDRLELFSKIEDGSIILSDVGKVIESVWLNIQVTEEGVTPLDFCIMPNHIHGILAFEQADIKLGEVIRRLKARVSHQIGYSIWQRNYYEHIIRDESDYCKIVQYIISNPWNWSTDIENI